MNAIIDKPAPQPEIECWVQGSEARLEDLHGQVVLIEVIQVNCPGCFFHALPEVISLHHSYQSQGLKVFAIATAFEHFEHNTLNNLERLLHQDELIGDPLTQLEQAGFLDGQKLPYRIPFSVAMDKLVKNNDTVEQADISAFIISQIPDFHDNSWDETRKQSIWQQAETHLRSKKYHALTFEMYHLQGTPSSILIDREGILRVVSFGMVNSLEPEIKKLLQE